MRMRMLATRLDYCTTLRRRAPTASMVREYKRKGGHGGSRLGAGLQPGHWEHQGGRKAAAQTKRDIEQRAAAKEASEKAKRTAMWLKVAAKSAAVQSGSGNHTSTGGQTAVKQGQPA